MSASSEPERLGDRLRQAPMLEGLDDETAELLAKEARWRQLEPGAVLFAKGNHRLAFASSILAGCEW